MLSYGQAENYAEDDPRRDHDYYEPNNYELSPAHGLGFVVEQLTFVLEGHRAPGHREERGASMELSQVVPGSDTKTSIGVNSRVSEELRQNG